ncbi:hypothetical protein [Streptomyces sp. NRRL S-1824]|uniref:hypothetical protein n=1 Tax=Streptomyces sp. NRRL S-1824 TaxID=1463889 RepID=UPI001F330199|nr:hypothetical protein [Streptomyces sp. NRRL S-1824]
MKDLPLAQQDFVIRMTVRRFICGAVDCPRRTFAEPFSGLAAPYARFAHRDCLRNPAPSGVLPETAHPGSGLPQDDSDPVGRRAERKKAAHALVHELLAQGHSRRAIARHLGWGLNTVLRYATAARCQDTIRENRPRPSRLDPYKPYLERRFAAGCTSVIRLHSELVAEQAPVTYAMVRAHIATLRGAPSGAPPRPPTVRQVTGWLTRHPTVLTEDDRAGLKDVLTRCPPWVSRCSWPGPVSCGWRCSPSPEPCRWRPRPVRARRSGRCASS